MPVWELPDAIRTPRLTLRAHRAGDLADLVAFHSDPEVVRYLPWPVRDEEATRVALAAKVAHVIAVKAGDYVVAAAELRETGRVIGEAVLMRKDDAGRHAELGYAFAREVHGRGIAREATDALIAFAEEAGVRLLTATVEEGNDASVKLLRRLGFGDADPSRTTDPEDGTTLLRFARPIGTLPA